MLMSNKLIIKHMIEPRAVDKFINKNNSFLIWLSTIDYARSGRQICLMNISEAIYWDAECKFKIRWTLV